MQKISLKKLVQDRVVTNISGLRVNISGYPYVTMLTGSKSQNVYFGQKTAELVSDTFSENDSVLSFLADAEIIQTTNEAGETRFKLSKNAGSDYATETAMADVFGVELSAGEFDVKLFASEFAAKEVAATGVSA
jgi:hypothetical protein